MQSKRLKLAWLYILLALGAIVALVLLSGRPPVPSVPTQVVTRANISNAISTNGKVEPVTPYEMRSLVQSHVTKIQRHGRPIRKKRPAPCRSG